MNRLVCYDITDNKLRKKIADKLIQFGLARVQLSVFIGYVAAPHYTKMKEEIMEKIDEGNSDTDSIIFMDLHQDQIKNMIILGRLQADADYILNTTNTIMI